MLHARRVRRIVISVSAMIGITVCCLTGTRASSTGIQGHDSGSSTLSAAVAPLRHSWGDHDGDGLQDVYVSRRIGEDRLFRNRGDGQFDDVSEQARIVGVRDTRSAQWEDLDRDGRQDLLILGVAGTVRLFRNSDAGIFDEVTEGSGLESATGLVAANCFDYDGDGLPDLHVATEAGEQLFRNLGLNLFERISLELPVAEEPGVARVARTTMPAGDLEERGRVVDIVEHPSRGGEAGASRAHAPRLPAPGDDEHPASAGPPGDPTSTPMGDGLRARMAMPCADAIADQDGGTCIQASRAPGVGGTLFPLGEEFFVGADGDVGIGTDAPAAALHVYDPSPVLLLQNKTGSGGFLRFLDNMGNRKGTIDSVPSDSTFRVVADPGQSLLLGANGSPGYISVSTSGNIGIGTGSPAELLHLRASGATMRIDDNGEADSYSNIRDIPAAMRFEKERASGPVEMDLNPKALDGVSDATIRFFRDTNSTGTKSVQLFRGDGSGFGSVQLGVDGAPSYFVDGDVGIGTTTPSSKLEVTGTTTTEVLTITGGSDLAEPFEVTGGEAREGMVLCIDRDAPGKLRLAEREYDTTVAGVVSGAGGVRAGLAMSQKGLLQDGKLVALAGRVYCWCDASAGAIAPGDLVTTSATPGHARIVTDRTRATGAILGKALTPLASGRGLVLIVVALQ